MRKHNYVVGFEGEKQYAYGIKDVEVIHLMTIRQAKKALKDLHGGCKAIFKLVEVKNISVEILKNK